MSEIRLPSLGADMEEATLLEWCVKPGDTVEFGTIVALLDTEKAEIEMESFVSGTIEALLIEPGETVDVGTPIATYLAMQTVSEQARPEAASETSLPASSAPPPVARPSTSAGDVAGPPRARPAPLPATPDPVGSPEGSGRVRATPLARRLAAERGLDLATIRGSGPHGAITEADVTSTVPATTDAPPTSASRVATTDAMAPPPAAAEETRPAPGRSPRSTSDRAARRREIIATAMARSKREIPHYYLSTSIDVHRTLERLAAYNADRPVDERLLLPALLVKAVASAVRRFPELNGHWLDDGFHPAEAVHLGMVVSLRTGGIIVPTIRNADERSLSDLMGTLRDLVRRARAGRLKSGELGDATITLTSLGEGGAETIFGVIYPPQVAIVGIGGVHPAVRAEGDLHGVRSVVQATLSADHRSSDGLQGSQFLAAVAGCLDSLELS